VIILRDFPRNADTKLNECLLDDAKISMSNFIKAANPLSEWLKLRRDINMT